MRIPAAAFIFSERVLGSLFLSAVIPLRGTTPEEALASFKSEHPKATHYPFAFVLGESCRESDDGEPHNAAGKPFLDLLRKNDVDQTLLLTARYFGGTKLGLPRLRATFLRGGKAALAGARYLTERDLGSFFWRLPLSEAGAARSFLFREAEKIEEKYQDEFVNFSFLADDRINEACRALFPQGALEEHGRVKIYLEETS